MTTKLLICRSYYRCTNTVDQGCQATKQVQQIQENPPRYLTTYYGHHTCKNSFQAPEILHSPTDDDQEDNTSPFLLSFGSDNPLNKPLYDPSPLPFASVKQEKNNVEVPKSSWENKLLPFSRSSASNLTTSSETFEPNMTTLSSVPHLDEICSGVVYPYDHEDGIIGTCTSDMTMFLDPINCFQDDASQFEFC